MLEGLSLLLLVVLGLAVAFDYINGFHDTANAIATSVSTRALKPRARDPLAATVNFVGAFAGTAVAKTIGAGLVDESTDDAGRGRGRPARGDHVEPHHLASSASRARARHALIGGLLGATHRRGRDLGASRWTACSGRCWSRWSPRRSSGSSIGFLLMVVLLNWSSVARSAADVDASFRRLQVLSAAYMAFSHGSNDAQKTMGIMTLALFAAGVIPSVEVPVWVIVVAATAISLGTAVGGWRIMRTMGHRVVKLEPVHGFAAETTAATILFVTAHSGCRCRRPTSSRARSWASARAPGPDGVSAGASPGGSWLAWVHHDPGRRRASAALSWFILHTIGFG